MYFTSFLFKYYPRTAIWLILLKYHFIQTVLTPNPPTAMQENVPNSLGMALELPMKQFSGSLIFFPPFLINLPIKWI